MAARSPSALRAAKVRVGGVGLGGAWRMGWKETTRLVSGCKLPPGDAGEEVVEVAVELEHGHGVVAAAVDPAAAGVGAPAGALVGAFAGGLVAAGEVDFPGDAGAGFGGAGRGFAVFAPALGVVVLVAVFLVDLGDDAAGLRPAAGGS